MLKAAPHMLRRLFYGAATLATTTSATITTSSTTPTMAAGIDASAGSNESRLPVYFISHGGGPWTHMKDELGDKYAKLEAALADIQREISGGRPYAESKPKAILMVSAHWETDGGFKVQSNPRPGMLYDYGGFPRHTYSIKYSAPGDPKLANRVVELLSGAGLPVTVDSQRGFDHGCFVPLFAMYPDADVPVVQLSINSNYDPATHVALGRALAPLRNEGVLIVGSGLTYHNLRRIWDKSQAAVPSKHFDDWIEEAVVQHKGAARTEQLLQWESAPYAREAHPQEDHFVPIFVAVGAAEDEDGVRVYHEDDWMGYIAVSNFRFGALPAGGYSNGSAGESAPEARNAEASPATKDEL